ncbi:MAG: hypothetical protein WA908_02165 [Pontixanthobacter sp.]
MGEKNDDGDDQPSWMANYSLDTPVRFAPQELQQDGKITLSPGFTPDGRTIYFGQSECSVIWQCPQKLKRSDLTIDGWSTPRLVPLPQDARAEAPSVTPDGKTLFFSWSGKSPLHAGRDRTENFDLWKLDLTRTDAEPVPVRGPNIPALRAGKVASLRFVNNETLPTVTTNGNLYFMTERLDGIGERDIYFARGGPDGTFQRAEPLPPPINSKGRDGGVWVSPDEMIMMLDYPGRGGSGKSDLFISIRSGDEWLEPVNLGARINSTARDWSPRLSPDMKTLIFTSDRAFGDQPEGLIQVWSVRFNIDEYLPQSS